MKLPPRTIHSTPFPSLTEVRIDLSFDNPTSRLVRLLSSIHSTPELSSVTFSFAGAWWAAQEFPSSGNWIVVDQWLARSVTGCTVARGGLGVVMAGWPEGNSNWEGYFPEFRRAGGELRREGYDDASWEETPSRQVPAQRQKRKKKKKNLRV
jgi:hypothetical protein